MKLKQQIRCVIEGQDRNLCSYKKDTELQMQKIVFGSIFKWLTKKLNRLTRKFLKNAIKNPHKNCLLRFVRVFFLAFSSLSSFHPSFFKYLLPQIVTFEILFGICRISKISKIQLFSAFLPNFLSRFL